MRGNDMAQEVNICFHLADNELARSISKNLRVFPFLKDVGSSTKPLISNAAAPHVAVLEDWPEAGDILDRIVELRKANPNLAIFVVSSNAQPEQIVKVMKAGATEYFLKPIDLQKFREAIDAVQSRLVDTKPTNRGAAYCFISSKGGLGSTVLAVNMAASMAEKKGREVALWDMGFQSGDASTLLDVVPERTIMDACRNFRRLDSSFLEGVMIKRGIGLNFLAAPSNPEELDEISSEQIGKIYGFIRELHRAVIIDCPSMLVNDGTVEVFSPSDKIFIVTDLSVPAVRNAARLFQLIQKLGISADKVEFVVNRFIKGSPLSVDAAEKNLGKSIFWLFPNDFENVISSINRGVPLVELNPKATLSKNMVEFAQKIQDPSRYVDYRGIRGVFGKAI